MKASLKAIAAGLLLLLLLPLSTAHAQGPSLSPIANVSVNAGSTLSVNVIAIDVADRVVTVTAALPPFATLETPTIGTGVVATHLTLTPSAAQVGDYTAAVTAEAGGVSSVRVFQITVNASGSDQAPRVVVSPLQEVVAGVALGFIVTADDPDGDAITSLSASDLPTGATFTPDGANRTARFDWTPAVEDVGEFDVSFTATNRLSGTAVAHLRVAPPPALTITPIDDVTVADGGFVSVPIHAAGVPGASIVLTAALPSFATLDPPGSGTGVVNTTVTVAPPSGSAGTYHASITAISEGTSVTEPFDIVVTGGSGSDNHAPVVAAPPTATAAVGSTLSFDVTATDADGDHVDLFGSALPPGSTFVDHGNDTGTFTWAPVSGKAGTYTASFTGRDGRGGSGSASTTITVTGGGDANHAPTLSAPPVAQVEEGANLSFTVTAADQDGDPVTLSTSPLPLGATFTDRGDKTGTFSWTPDTTQSGIYEIAFHGSDGRGGTGTAATTITVLDVRHDPSREIPGRACLIGNFDPRRDSTCFRIRPVDHSFALGDVVLSSIRLRFHGESIPALDGARIDLYCHDRQGHGDDDDEGEGDDDGDGGDGDHHDRAATRLDGDHRHGDDGGDDDECGVSCPDHRHDDRDDDHDDGEEHGGACDTLGIRACFSTTALLGLFPDTTAAGSSPESKRLPCALVDAEILATLTNGATVVAAFRDHGHDDDGDDDHGGKDDDGDDDSANGSPSHGDAALRAEVKPNPLAPSTKLSFAIAREGRVRVTVHDLQGRQVKKLLDDFRAAGSQTVGWDGTDESNQRVTSGVYFVRIVAQDGSVTRRVTVVK